MSLEKAKRVIDFLVSNRFLVAYFTGGEPTLFPHLPDLVRYAHEAGMITTMTSNGTAPLRVLEKLKECGLQSISISLDHYDSAVCESIRGFRGIMARQVQAILYARSLGLKPYALTYLSPQILRDGVAKLIDYANQTLGVPWGFCFPTEAKNSFTLKYEDQQVGELKATVREILAYKLRDRGAVANTLSYLEDSLNFLNGLPTKNECRSGRDVVYVDWQGDVYPCFLREKMFNALTDEPNFKKIECDRCLTNCFREPSYLAQLSLPFILREIGFHNRNRRGGTTM